MGWLIRISFSLSVLICHIPSGPSIQSHHCLSAICGLTFHSSFPQVICAVCENTFKEWNGGISRGSNWIYFRKYHITVVLWMEKWRAYFKGNILFSYLFLNDFMFLCQGFLCSFYSPIQKLNQQCSFLQIRF